MPTPRPSGRLEFLEDYSNRDQPWDASRRITDKTSKLLNGTRHHAHGQRMSRCSTRLTGRVKFDSEGTGRFNVQRVFQCHCRQCMVCQRSRVRVWHRRFAQGIPIMMSENPTIKLLFLTLTVENCPIGELKANLDHMSRAFKKLMMRSAVDRVVVGYARGMEVTRSKNDYAHPHFHVLLAVKTTYFKGDHYITQDAWATMWQEALDVEYKPITDIRAVKPKRGKQTEQQTIMDAVRETAKYMTKASDLVGDNTPIDQAWLLDLTDQIHGTKQMNLGGIFRKYIKTVEPTPEEILESQDDEDDTDGNDKSLITFNWYGSLGKYARKVAR